MWEEDGGVEHMLGISQQLTYVLVASGLASLLQEFAAIKILLGQ